MIFGSYFRLLSFVYPFLLGTMSAIAWIVPLLWPLSCLALVLLVVRLRTRRSPWHDGWFYGCGAYSVALSGVYTSLHTYGGIPVPFALLLLAGLIGVLCLGWGAVGWIWTRWQTGHPVWDAFWFGALVGLSEWGWSTLALQFPWALFGYALVDSPLATLAPWIGVYGISIAGCTVCAWISFLGSKTSRNDRSIWIVPLGVLASLWLLSFWSFTVPSTPVRISLLQTATDQKEKILHRQLSQRFQKLSALIEQAKGDLIITPETTIPRSPERLETLVPGWWDQWLKEQRQRSPTLLLGSVVNVSGGVANAMMQINRSGVQTYTKKHLVPFGEVIPFGFQPLLQRIGIPLGSFVARTSEEATFVVGDTRLAVSICFEDAYAIDWARQLSTQPTPSILVNISNLGWFGHSAFLPHHIQVAKMRAREFQRPFVRAGNIGPTLVVQPDGHVSQQLPVYTEGILEATVTGHTGWTPYARGLANWGMWPLLGWFIFMSGIIWWHRRRSLHPHDPSRPSISTPSHISE